MKALVTGGAGFVGSHLVDKLIQEGFEVHIADNLSRGKEKYISDKAILHKGDISNEKYVSKLFNTKFDYVFHLAAVLSAKNYHENIDKDVDTNIKGTYYLLKNSLETEVKKFIFTSSFAIYGNIPKRKVSENHPTNPLSVYGITKLTSEKYIHSFADQGLNSTILRPFSIYGSHIDISDRKRGMVSIFMSYVANNEPILCLGPRNRFRDFIYVSDAIDAIYKASISPKTNGKIYNLCSGKKTTLETLHNTIIKGFGHNPKDYPIIVEKQAKGDKLFGIYGSNEKLKEDIDWRPEVSLQDGIKKTVKWIEKTNS